MPKLNVVAGIIDKVADKIDEFTLDKTEKAQLIQEINKAQIEVNKVEANSNSLFVSGWRPFVGWVCGIALLYHFILTPCILFGVALLGIDIPPLPAFDMSSLLTVLMGMLGLGGLRTFEKTKGVSK